MTQTILEKINQRQRQVILYSVFYYTFDMNVITDTKWMEFAQELVQLQRDYPAITERSVFYETMKGFDGSTGAHLANNEWGLAKAEHRIQYG